MKLQTAGVRFGIVVLSVKKCTMFIGYSFIIHLALNLHSYV